MGGWAGQVPEGRDSTPMPSRKKERESTVAILAQVDPPLPFGGGGLEGGPADLLFAAEGLLGGRPFERG